MAENRELASLQRSLDLCESQLNNTEKRLEALQRENERLQTRLVKATRATGAEAGVMTKGADMVMIIGTSAGTMIWNKAQRANGADTLWAIAELLIGGLVAVNVATAGAPYLRNLSLGIAVGGAGYLVDRLIP